MRESLSYNSRERPFFVFDFAEIGDFTLLLPFFFPSHLDRVMCWRHIESLFFFLPSVSLRRSCIPDIADRIGKREREKEKEERRLLSFFFYFFFFTHKVRPTDTPTCIFVISSSAAAHQASSDDAFLHIALSLSKSVKQHNYFVDAHM